MKKLVNIKLKGTQKDIYGEEDTITHELKGQFFWKNEAYYIVYKESIESGMEGTTTSIKVDGQTVTLNRMGTSQIKQVYQEGVSHRSVYHTPYGTMDLEIFPRKVDVYLTESGGSINLKYELTIGAEKVSSNSLQVTVEEDLS